MKQSRRELKQRVHYLEQLQAITNAKKDEREAAFFKQLSGCIGDGYLVLPMGAVIPVRIANCDLQRESPYVPFDIKITVYPQPPE